MDPEITGAVIPLRLVHSGPEPEVPYCVQIPCMTRNRKNPATMLIRSYDNPGRPSCDSCARWEFDLDTSGRLSLAPLGNYVDRFAAAREAALAPPLVVPPEDRVIYCQEHEFHNGPPSPADYFIRTENKPGDGALACSACLHKWQIAHPAGRLIPFGEDNDELPDAAGLTDRIWICPLSARTRDWLWATFDEVRTPTGDGNNGSNGHGGGQPPADGPRAAPKLPPKTVRQLWWTAGLSALASLALGITLCALSVHLQKSVMTAWGIFFIALPVLVAIGAFVVFIIQEIAKDIQKEKAWKTTLTPGQQLGVEVAETAAVWAGAYAVHEGLKHHEEHSAPVAARRAANGERQHGLRQHLADMNQQYQQQQGAGLAGFSQRYPVTSGGPVPPENRNPMLQQRTARQRLRTDLAEGDNT